MQTASHAMLKKDLKLLNKFQFYFQFFLFYLMPIKDNIQFHSIY